MPEVTSRFLTHHILRYILLILLAVPTALCYQANLIQNGGFEVAAEYISTVNIYSTDPTYIFPWVLYATERVGVPYELDSRLWPPAEGLWSLELVSDFAYGIYQEVNLDLDSYYVLQYSICTNAGFDGGFQVTGYPMQPFPSFLDNCRSTNAWIQQSYPFKAYSATTRVYFQANLGAGASGVSGPAIDMIILNAVCDAGQIYDITNFICSNCPMGTSSIAGATVCTDCDAGMTSVPGGRCTIIPIVYPKILPIQGVRYAIQPSWDFSLDCESPPTVIYVFNVTKNSDGSTAMLQTYAQPEGFSFFDRLAPVSYICPARLKYGKTGQCCLVSRDTTDSVFSSAMLISGTNDLNATRTLFPVSSNLAPYCRIVSLDPGQALFG